MHYYADVQDYLAFSRPVPLKISGRYAEALFRDVARSLHVGVTLQGRAMRLLDTSDFEAIVLYGMQDTLDQADVLGLEAFDAPSVNGDFRYTGFAEEAPRRIEAVLLNRMFRDANFRLEVCRAYDNTCAVTGLRLINGGGRAEVQAAHILPVAAGGPDIAQNGIALCSTVHWMFDRHLISIDPEDRLLVAHNRVPAELLNLFRPRDEPLPFPKNPRLRPNPAFVARHREIFAGKYV
jgi:putative restriction endonuclease